MENRFGTEKGRCSLGEKFRKNAGETVVSQDEFRRKTEGGSTEKARAKSLPAFGKFGQKWLCFCKSGPGCWQNRLILPRHKVYKFRQEMSGHQTSDQKASSAGSFHRKGLIRKKRKSFRRWIKKFTFPLPVIIREAGKKDFTEIS